MVSSRPLSWGAVLTLLVTGSSGYPQQRSSSSVALRSSSQASPVIPPPTLVSSRPVASKSNVPDSSTIPSTPAVIPIPSTHSVSSHNAVPSPSSTPNPNPRTTQDNASPTSPVAFTPSSNSPATSSSSGIAVAPGLPSQSRLSSSSSDSQGAPVAGPTTPVTAASSTAQDAGSTKNGGTTQDASSTKGGGVAPPAPSSSGGSGGDSDDDDDPTKGGTAFAPVSASMDAPENKGPSAAVKNAGNSAQTATIVRGELPSDQASKMPAFPFGDVLPIKLTIGGKQKVAVVDSFLQMAIPLDDDADWLTPNDIPQPGAVGVQRPEGSEESGNLCSVSVKPPSPTESQLVSSIFASATVPPATTPPSTTAPSTTSPSTISSKPSSTPSSSAPSSTLNCQQNIPTGGPSASQVAKALRNDDSFSGFCDQQASAGSLYQSIKHGMLEISVTRGSSGDTLHYCKQGMQGIIDTCITGSSDYGGVYSQGAETYNITNIIYPYNPLEVDVDDGAPPTPISVPTPTPTPSEPPMPTETSGNNDGSGLCKSLQGTCAKTVKLFNDDYIYKDYSYVSRSAGDYSPINAIFLFADNGCKAEFKCDNYGEGMSGRQIKQAAENMFKNDNVQECGSAYLSNSCQIKLNGCNDHCGSHVPCDSLKPDDSREGCY